VCVRVRVHVCVRARMCVCVRKRVCVRCVCVYTIVYIRMCVRCVLVRVYVCAHVRVCAYMCACGYVCAREYVVRACACEGRRRPSSWCPSSPREGQPPNLLVPLGALMGGFLGLSPFMLKI